MNPAVQDVLARLADGWVLERGYMQDPADLTRRDAVVHVEWLVYLELVGLVDFFAPCESGDRYEAYGYLTENGRAALAPAVAQAPQAEGGGRA